VPTAQFQETGENIAARTAANFSANGTQERLYRMIDYAIKRHDWYEDQRNKTLALAIALLGLSSFLVSGLLSSGASDLLYFRIYGGLTIGSIILTSLTVIFEYAKGAQEKYTHRSLADIRSWFFAYAINDSVIRSSVYDCNKNKENERRLINAWETFVQEWGNRQGNQQSIAIEDLQQVFILYLFQGIRRNSLRRMLMLTTIGGIIIGGFMITTVFCAAVRI